MTINNSNKEKTTYEISLSMCPYCNSRLHINTLSSDLKRSVESILQMSKIHLKSCSFYLQNKKIATIKIKTTVESKEYTSIAVVDNSIIL